MLLDHLALPAMGASVAAARFRGRLSHGSSCAPAVMTYLSPGCLGGCHLYGCKPIQPEADRPSKDSAEVLGSELVRARGRKREMMMPCPVKLSCRDQGAVLNRTREQRVEFDESLNKFDEVATCQSRGREVDVCRRCMISLSHHLPQVHAR